MTGLRQGCKKTFKPEVKKVIIFTKNEGKHENPGKFPRRKITNMIEVNAEGNKFIYDADFAYNELRKLKNIGMEADAMQFINRKELSTICRPAICHYVVRDFLYLKYLFWYQETELKELDKKIKTGLYTNTDFRYSITTYFVPKLFCLQCGYHCKALVVDTVGFYIMNRALAIKKTNEVINMGKWLSCPQCDTRFRILAVHLWEC